jgi:anti-anti-sigma factor
MSLADLTQSGSTAVVSPAGELDAATVEALGDEVTALRRAGAERVVVDLGGVTFLDSRGLGVLLVLRNDAKRAGQELLLVPGPPQVQRVFALTRTRGLFDWA